jgi:FkbM family methyltransferase
MSCTINTNLSYTFETENMNLIVTKSQFNLFTNFQTAQHESLLRKIVKELFTTKTIHSNSNIIDIGAHNGGHAIPWTRLTSGYVYAIDPSSLFCNNIIKVSMQNNIRNICVLRAAGDSHHRTLKFKGDGWSMHNINETRYKASNTVNAVPLDSLNINNIGLLHIDVEGFENNVLSGSKIMIKRDQPIIISEELKNNLTNRTFLKGYKRYEIPEECGSKYCRNNLWIPAHLLVPQSVETFLRNSVVPYVGPK